jgi:16S rRNA (adenine1518-N6/adenine1519-N6)-dimethyltransferase
VPGDRVLEIGPGQGTLTARLLAAGLRVVAIEKDRRLAAELGTRNAERGTERLRVVEGDALRMDWHVLLDDGLDVPRSAFRVPRLAVPRSAFPVPRFKIVGNIPYNITSPLIEKALTPPIPARIVFLVQAEVADRIAARPGTGAYGALSIGVQAVCRAERLFTVRAGAFRPPPRVRSAVVLARRSPILVTPRSRPRSALSSRRVRRRRKVAATSWRAWTGRRCRWRAGAPRHRPDRAPRDAPARAVRRALA